MHDLFIVTKHRHSVISVKPGKSAYLSVDTGYFDTTAQNFDKKCGGGVVAE